MFESRKKTNQGTHELSETAAAAAAAVVAAAAPAEALFMRARWSERRRGN